MPDTPKPKTAAQIKVDTLNRKRKPLITFETKDVEVLKKQHAAEIEALNRQLAGMQTELTTKEAKIQELEDQIEKLQKPVETGPPIVKTEEVPGTGGTRRQRQAAAAKPAAPVETVVVVNDAQAADIKAAIEKNPEVVKNVLKENAPAVAAILKDTEPPKTPQAPAAKPVRPGDGIEEDDA